MKFWIQHTPDVLIERFGNMLNICKDLVDNFLGALTNVKAKTMKVR